MITEQLKQHETCTSKYEFMQKSSKNNIRYYMTT